MLALTPFLPEKYLACRFTAGSLNSGRGICLAVAVTATQNRRGNPLSVILSASVLSEIEGVKNLF
jgi:hypothetical protein